MPGPAPNTAMVLDIWFAPGLWRRHLALLLDGFRAEGAHPLPEPPLPSELAHPAARD